MLYGKDCYLIPETNHIRTQHTHGSILSLRRSLLDPCRDIGLGKAMTKHDFYNLSDIKRIKLKIGHWRGKKYSYAKINAFNFILSFILLYLPAPNPCRPMLDNKILKRGHLFPFCSLICKLILLQNITAIICSDLG